MPPPRTCRSCRALQTNFSQANADKLQGYLRAVQTWATETHGELSKVVEAEVTEINKGLTAALEKAAKSAPSGSEFAFAAMKQAMSAGNQAYDAIAKAGKQVVDITESTVAATDGRGQEESRLKHLASASSEATKPPPLRGLFVSGAQ